MIGPIIVISSIVLIIWKIYSLFKEQNKIPRNWVNGDILLIDVDPTMGLKETSIHISIKSIDMDRNKIYFNFRNKYYSIGVNSVQYNISLKARNKYKIFI